MQYYYIKEKFRNKYGNYYRYVVFLFEDRLKQFQKIRYCELRSQKTPRGILPVNSNENTTIAIEITYFGTLQRT